MISKVFPESSKKKSIHLRNTNKSLTTKRNYYRKATLKSEDGQRKLLPKHGILGLSPSKKHNLKQPVSSISKRDQSKILQEPALKCEQNQRNLVKKNRIVSLSPLNKQKLEQPDVSISKDVKGEKFQVFPKYNINNAAYLEKKNKILGKKEKFQYDQTLLYQLHNMDLSLNCCKRALYATQNQGIDQALNWVVEHINDEDFNDPFNLTGSEDEDKYDSEAYSALIMMGFTQIQAIRAVKATNNDLGSAVDWIFSDLDSETIDCQNEIND